MEFWSVERLWRDDGVEVINAKLSLNVLQYDPACGPGKSDERRYAVARFAVGACDTRQIEIRRSEIVPPFGDTVRFVDYNDGHWRRDGHGPQRVAESSDLEPFGRDIGE